MGQFVGVRMVKANSVDLSLFQFDYDMTFAVFFMNADRTIYGRYGTRSEYDAAKAISLPGFGKAFQGVLDLHQEYPRNKRTLLAKTGSAPLQRIPEDFPALRSLRSGQNAVTSCIHCHQVLDAKRDQLRTAKKPISDKDVFPYPIPDVIGLVLDPEERAKISRVLADSPAAMAGFRPGDEIKELNGQPIISIADVQWVLHNVVEADAQSSVKLDAKVLRQVRLGTLTISLRAGWRRNSDILWRATTWEMNRIVGGSLKWKTLTDAARKRLGLAPNATAIQVDFVGWWGPYQAGKRAGFKKGDVMISFDNQRTLKDVNEFYAYAMNKAVKGKQVAVEILRNGRKMSLQLPMQ